MPTDDHAKILRPTLELIASLRDKVDALEADAIRKFERYRYDDPKYASELWDQFNRSVEPTRREITYAEKIITDYYARLPLPPMIIEKV